MTAYPVVRFDFDRTPVIRTPAPRLSTTADPVVRAPMPLPLPAVMAPSGEGGSSGVGGTVSQPTDVSGKGILMLLAVVGFGAWAISRIK